LTDAQRVQARAYGFSSWPALKNHVEGVNIVAFVAAAEAGDVAAVRRLAKARPDLINQHHTELGSALHRAVLRRNQAFSIGGLICFNLLAGVVRPVLQEPINALRQLPCRCHNCAGRATTENAFTIV
jgi:hypothetical protein